jgi:hypothetical protein
MSFRRRWGSFKVVRAPLQVIRETWVVSQGHPGSRRGHPGELGGLQRSSGRPGWSLEVTRAPIEVIRVTWVVSRGHPGDLGGLSRSSGRP